MKLEWIEDMIALSETRSLSEAATRRHVTQPAFSRRIRQIEDYLGMDIVDRSHRPVRPHDSLLKTVPHLRETANQLEMLPLHLAGSKRIVIACQHATAISSAPEIARRILSVYPDFTVRLRSANRESCLMLLMSHQVDMICSYETADLPIIDETHFLTKEKVKKDYLVPVASRSFDTGRYLDRAEKRIPIISYPQDVFLGKVMYRNIIPSLVNELYFRNVIETGFTLAALELASHGFGIAWIPESLVPSDLSNKNIVLLRDSLVSCEMSLVMTKRRGEIGEQKGRAWKAALNQDRS